MLDKIKLIKNTIQEEDRVNACKKCDQYSSKIKVCLQCGCFIPAKVKLTMATCPLDKWKTSLT